VQKYEEKLIVEKKSVSLQRQTRVSTTKTHYHEKILCTGRHGLNGPQPECPRGEGDHRRHRQPQRPRLHPHHPKGQETGAEKADGFEASLGAVFAEISSTPINFYTKVDGNSKSATVTVCAISTDLSANQQTINNNVVNFLKNFSQYVDKREAAEHLEEAQEALKKAEKEKKNAEADLAKLEKAAKKSQDKIADLQSDIEKWNKNIANAEKEIKDLNADIDKATNGRIPDAKKRVQEAEKAYEEAQAIVEKYRKLAE